MVKLGFIVEGATEKIILERSDFFAHLQASGINYVPEVIDAKGNGNLLPHNIERHSRILEEKGATNIIILTDLDTDECITHTRERIAAADRQHVVVSLKAIESWFLADTDAIRRYVNDANFVCDQPEAVLSPFDEIVSIRLKMTGRGISTKTILANTMVHKMAFSILKAANHPNCESAKYFLDKIRQVAAGA